MRTGHRILLLTGAAVAASAAVAQPQQKVTGPVAVYWMSAATQSGFGMPGGGGGRPSMSQVMQMMNGGGGAQHSLVLQLGSSEHPSGPPSAEHLPPAGLGAGATLPLVSPEAPPLAAREEAPERPQIPPEYQKPKGRMLIFWGCGDHARPGQPVVLDFAEMSAGKIPPGMAMLGKGLDIRRMQPPSASRYASYGDWPNAKSRSTVPGTGSLVGQHMIHGDYSPEIKFSLDQNQDFLGPLILTTNTKTPGGPAQLGWAPVSGAQAYAATVIGAGGGRGGGDTTVVLWSSSEVEAAAFALPDYISPGDLARGVESHTLMGSQTTSCQVPKEVVDAAPQGFLQMVAYGREANFVYPPRPTDPKIAWNRQWEVKVRYRSATGGLLGMTMPATGGGRGSQGAAPGGPQPGQDQPPPDPAAARRRAILNGLGGLIPH
ncbi:hypothetical protein [Phenylobacterium sp.]|jgi:hypothetical protein|uniref:hypothetical protein n=1 Tax=Phenylobacterium sp. TaxID=1871053 RepID=UPI002E315DCA|nr:hypothetical protein [Phenylobacterium sp.]HEX3366199.1 hypothetical protein [Phenylobacterium sp.]